MTARDGRRTLICKHGMECGWNDRAPTLDLEPMTHSHPSLYVRATYALVSCTTQMNETKNVPTTSRISM